MARRIFILAVGVWAAASCAAFWLQLASSVIPAREDDDDDWPDDLPDELPDMRGVERVVARRRTWTPEQWRGRRRLEGHFRARGVPREYREHAFAGLVWAARRGYRGQRLIERASEYLTETYGQGVDWWQVLSVLLQVVSVLLTILILFTPSEPDPRPPRPIGSSGSSGSVGAAGESEG